MLDLSSKGFTNEVDKFCQFFNIIEKAKKKAHEDDEYNPLSHINSMVMSNKNISHDLKFKPSRKYTLKDSMFVDSNVWLIKPNDFNRGRGVMLFNSLEQLRRLLKEFSIGNEMDFYVHNACCQILSNEKSIKLKPKDKSQQGPEEVLPVKEQDEEEADKKGD